jgi:cellulose synthase (UDP-forming)
MIGAFKKLLTKGLLLYGAVLLFVYFVVRVQLISLSPYWIVFSVLLVIAETYTMIHFLGAVYALWPRKYEEYNAINENKDLLINMLICVCGEPAELLRDTIIAAKKTAEQYAEQVNPKTMPRVVVINDGYAAKKDNWQEVEKLCAELGVMHIARKTSAGYKAGNINNALQSLPTNDPHNTIDIVFDADFAALPKFLIEITKPFVNTKVDFVQTPQRYKNEKTWVAKAAGAHQINFFEHYCAAKAHDNALFLCGTNFGIRRSALNAVGGMDTRFITEDYSTSLNLHLAGKKGVFIKEPLAVGVAPSTLTAYFSQQRRWAKGTFDTSFAYLPQIIFGPLTRKQKMHYFIAATYYFIGVRDFILILGPLPYLYFNTSLIQASPAGFLAYIYIPMVLFNFLTYMLLFREPIKSLILHLISFPIFFSAFLSSVFKKKLGFVVTIKKHEQENVFVVYKSQLIIGAFLIGGFIFNMLNYKPSGTAAIINYFWTAYDVVCLTIGFGLIIKESLFSKLDEVAYSKIQSTNISKLKPRLSFATVQTFISGLTIRKRDSLLLEEMS